MDLEEYALQRDKRFLVRLIVSLVIGLLFGSWVFAKLTGEDVANCAAQGFRNVADEPPQTTPAPSD